jgi:hypothetical protein
MAITHSATWEVKISKATNTGCVEVNGTMVCKFKFTRTCKDDDALMGFSITYHNVQFFDRIGLTRKSADWNTWVAWVRVFGRHILITKKGPDVAEQKAPCAPPRITRLTAAQLSLLDATPAPATESDEFDEKMESDEDATSDEEESEEGTTSDDEEPGDPPKAPRADTTKVPTPPEDEEDGEISEDVISEPETSDDEEPGAPPSAPRADATEETEAAMDVDPPQEAAEIDEIDESSDDEEPGVPPTAPRADATEETEAATEVDHPPQEAAEIDETSDDEEPGVPPTAPRADATEETEDSTSDDEEPGVPPGPVVVVRNAPPTDDVHEVHEVHEAGPSCARETKTRPMSSPPIHDIRITPGPPMLEEDMASANDAVAKLNMGMDVDVADRVWGIVCGFRSDRKMVMAGLQYLADATYTPVGAKYVIKQLIATLAA